MSTVLGSGTGTPVLPICRGEWGQFNHFSHFGLLFTNHLLNLQEIFMKLHS